MPCRSRPPLLVNLTLGVPLDDRLLALDACAVLPTEGHTWQELSYWRTYTGRADLATTVMASLEHDASDAGGPLRQRRPACDLHAEQAVSWRS
ncbi:hypothetical protein GA0070624_5285 [Micromonospora rhizosphaerae]|uniref:Uncharacterized protein n=1 Tax=Micromonospora rhizosphaerae TaxID=568872 RepID=A0A1C6T139_9ACTN|nr:hypothetical protein GA0070624_5285 [Micromonospora rhizosphaerae]